MCRFIESIGCRDGEARLLDLHQKRVNRTFADHFAASEPLDLSHIIGQIPTQGNYKCRIEYGRKDLAVEFLEYSYPKIETLQLVEGDQISYAYKFANRTNLTSLFDARKGADDIVIVKNGKITDSYFANLALFDGQHWVTPEHPLLKGVKREYLLSTGELKTRKITIEDLHHFKEVSPINAMLDLGQICIPIKKLIFF